jgi:antitoxin component YwqK of YwqJK toxin-antitoxin module
MVIVTIIYKMRGYKIFEADYTCRGYKYSLDDWNVYSGEVKMCNSGFHYCQRALDCLLYYDYAPNNTYAIVESKYESMLNDKVVCKELKIVKTLTYSEFGELLTGDVNTKDKKCSYVKGKLHGDYQTWYPGGVTHIKAIYNNGKRIIYQEWDSNGILKVDESYDEFERFQHKNDTQVSNYYNGRIHGQSQIYKKDGQLYDISNYQHGVLHGECKSYNCNGKHKFVKVTNYKYGKKHGFYRVWIEGKNNFLLENAFFLNGKQQGVHKKWDETGKLVSTDKYKDGVKMNKY